MSTQNYKYVVVEDEHLIRKNIIKKISSLQLPFTLAGEASNGLDARDIIRKNMSKSCYYGYSYATV